MSIACGFVNILKRKKDEENNNSSYELLRVSTNRFVFNFSKLMSQLIFKFSKKRDLIF